MSVEYAVIYMSYYILDKNKNIIMETGICFTNTLQYIGTLSQIEFGTIKHLVNRKEKSKINGLIVVCRLYGARGFTVRVSA